MQHQLSEAGNCQLAVRVSTRTISSTALQRPRRRNRARKVHVTHANLSAKGRAYQADVIQVKRSLGEGSFGQVFEGLLKDDRTGNARVVLKRVKTKVEGAEAMGQMEHVLNVHAAKVAKGSCADFLGYCEVNPDEASVRLTPGLWLVWKYEGNKTLAYYLRRRDTVQALSVDLDVTPQAAVATVMKQLFEGLSILHASGLVHRDIKPLNIIFAEEQKRFKLIDLGACADLRTGTNYVPDESILDPNYCPPEQYVLPTDAPHLSKTPLAMAISPMLWAQYKPDRFDMFSAGLVLVQLALPSLRSDRALKSFRSALEAQDYDLTVWRSGSALSRLETDILDANDGAGWDLAQALLRPRNVERDDEGNVSFVNDNSTMRVSAAEALRHPFIAQATVPGSMRRAEQEAAQAAAASTAAGGGMKGALAAINPAKIWASWTSRVYELEASLVQATSDTQLQTTTVVALREKVAVGKASQADLAKEERQLAAMEQRVQGQQSELQGVLAQGANLFRRLGFKRDDKTSTSESGSTADAEAAPRPSLWQQVSRQLLDLEMKISIQESATEKQSLTVRKLRRAVKTGAADPERLKRAETVYARMVRRLEELRTDYNQTTAKAAAAIAAKDGSTSSSGRTTSTRPPGSGSTRSGSGWTQSSRSGSSQGVKVDSATTSSTGSGIVSGSKWFFWGSQSTRPVGGSESKGGTTKDIRDRAGDFMEVGLKLGGLAARMAGDIASSIKEDANRMMKEAEEEASRKQQVKVAERLFTEMLRVDLKLTSTSSYEDVAAAAGGDPRFTVVPEAKRRLLVAMRLDAVRKEEEQAREQSRVLLKDMFRRNGVTHDSDWSTFNRQLQSQPVFAAATEQIRREAFEEVVMEAQTSRMTREAQFKSERAFVQLLTEVSDPPVTAESSWAIVKVQMLSDPRFIALAEPHRRAIFLQYQKELMSRAAAAVAALSMDPLVNMPLPPAATAFLNPAPSTAGTVGTAGTAGVAGVAGTEGTTSPVRKRSPYVQQQQQPKSVPTANLPSLPPNNTERVKLEELREEQLRLKEEYSRMEQKLREMEEKLRRSQRAARSGADVSSVSTYTVAAENAPVGSDGGSDVDAVDAAGKSGTTEPPQPPPVLAATSFGGGSAAGSGGSGNGGFTPTPRGEVEYVQAGVSGSDGKDGMSATSQNGVKPMY